MSDILTHHEIGKRLGISTQRVQQIERQALFKLLKMVRASEWGVGHQAPPHLHESRAALLTRTGICMRCQVAPAQKDARQCRPCADMVRDEKRKRAKKLKRSETHG